MSKRDASLEWPKSGESAGSDPLGQEGGQERSERGQMAEAVLGGVEEEYRVAPGCIGMRLVSK